MTSKIKPKNIHQFMIPFLKRSITEGQGKILPYMNLFNLLTLFCIVEMWIIKDLIFDHIIQINKNVTIKWWRKVTYDLSIASTKTKYIKLNTITQNIFCRLNENLTTFLYTLTGATRKQKEKNIFFKCIQKSNVIKKNLGFSI